MKKNKTIIITGTHHTPGIELINLLKKDSQINWKIYYLGHQYPSETHILNTIIPELKDHFFNLDCGKFDRKNIDITLLGIPKTVKALFTSLSLISRLKPDVIVSFGGYVSVPVVVASFFKRIPSITHEQTLTNSLATKINSLFVNKVALSFNNSSQIRSLPKSKVVVTGNLIRQEIFKTDTRNFSKVKTPFIYFTGGNQGSKFLNDTVYKIIPKLPSQISVIHQTGKNDSHQIEDKLKATFPNYFPVDFVNKEDIGFALNQSSVIISRSGANICQELDILDKSAILIPLPYTQQDEQLKNAIWLKQLHPDNTIIVNQNSLNTKHLISSIKTLINLRHTSIQKRQQLVHPLSKLIHEIIN